VRSRLPLSRGRNFRDLGGIATVDGRLTARGRLFRADELHGLSPDDLDLLAAIPIATVIDFRSTGEVARHPDKLPASVKDHLLLPIVPGGLEPWDPDEALRIKGGHGFMTDLYRSLVLDEPCVAMYREFFRCIQARDRLPLLFHCSAGKDRTGLAAAFTQLALGVSRRDIMRDYMDSNICLAGKYDHFIARRLARAPVFFADPEYLRAAIAAMEEKSGSVERYLISVLGVDAELMRERFLL
jgi:protein-tyrosine phosphatase